MPLEGDPTELELQEAKQREVSEAQKQYEQAAEIYKQYGITVPNINFSA